MSIFDQPKCIIEKLKKHGFEAFFVGGSVRDYVMNREIGDIDITTSAKPEEVMQIFPKHVPIGLQHGTILVLQDSIGYEVTTYRTEGEYENFRAPKEVTFVSNLDEDLKRRDFTMNAIAMNESLELYDPFSGQKDIKKKRIVTVGSAEERFTEDALRMLRAVRFMSSLGFSLDETTERAISKHVSLLQFISVERKLAEFDKLLLGKNVVQALQKMNELAVFDYLPHLLDEKNAIEQFLKDSSNILETSLANKWAVLCLRIEYDSLSFLKSWKMSSKRMKEITTIEGIVKEVMQTNVWNRLSILKFGYDACKSAEEIITKLQLCELRNSLDVEFSEMLIKERNELVVTGNHLQKWFERKPGPWIQIELDKIIEAVLYNKVVNNEQHIKEWLKSCN